MRMRSAAALLAALVACAAWGNGDDRVYIECPCTATREGESLTVTAGLRSFREVDTGALRMEVRAAESQAARSRAEKIGVASLVATVAAEATVERASYSTVATDADGVRYVRLVLQEEHGGEWGHLDEIRMAGAVDVAADFTVHDLDYLADSDGDGVGDVNEGLEGTDPADAESTPGASTIDVVALYSQGFPALYENDPTSRIQHLFSVANTYLADSQLALEFRLVGMAPTSFDEDEQRRNPDIATRTAEAERHGADLVVVFRPAMPNVRACGWANLGGRDQRGYIDFKTQGDDIATVIGDCGAGTLAHEIGHLLGLHHSFWQGSTGAWRWSRGHDVEDDFYTIMSYGRYSYDPTKNKFTTRPANVFSSPDGRCTGEQMVAKPCGVGHAEVDAADARTSIDAVRFQFARFRGAHADGDGDGFVDPVDAFPRNEAEWWDTDADGVGNNADADDDNDGVDDAADWRPLDSSESADRDADGVGDNADAFPDDPAETADTDGDGVGDNADEFPNDPLETVDTDGDGVGDNGDAFPDDPAESVDTDGDGVGDNADPDADADGVDDIRDVYPRDASRSDLTSWKLVGEAPGDELGGGAVTAADLDGDGVVELIVGAASHDGVEDAPRSGAVYVVSAGDLPWMDSQDGAADRVVDLAFAAPARRSWKVVGAAYDHVGAAQVVGDVDGDGASEIVVGASDKDTVYLLEAADLGTLDAKDGSTDGVVDLAHVGGGTGSWKLVGERRSRFGYDVAVGDADGDRLDDLLIGADKERIDETSWAGAAYHLPGRHLARADSADGAADGVIALSSAVTAGAAMKFVGAAGEAARVGGAVSLAGDFDGDGRRELVIGAPDRGAGELRNAGIVHILSGRVLRAADRLDGDAEGVVELPGTHALARSWRVVGDERWQLVGGFVAAAAMRAGDPASLVIGTIHGNSTYVLAGRDLSAADAEDGAVDGSITARNIALQPDSWEMAGLRHRWQWINGRRLVAVGDYDADGTADLLVGADRWNDAGVSVLFSAAELAAFRESDAGNGRLDLYPWSDWGVPAWRFAGPAYRDWAGRSVSFAGDIDGDGAAEIAIGAPGDDTGGGDAGAVYLVLAGEMGALDRLDGTPDRRAALGNLAGDTDGDGIGNTTDPDDDDDGVRDVEDRFQLDAAEWADADGDGYGDNGDAFPHDWREWLDTDFDGVGNNADDDDDGDGIPDEDERESGMELDTDNDGLDNDVDADDDNDGVADADDAFPVDAGEQSDTDGDGLGNHADRDDDGDRVADKNDAFPLDPSETNDADGDGTGDNADAFPNDPAEWVDTDADGIGNNADTDDDGDGVADADDDLPLDATGSVDTDGDGVADPNDAFPSDADEWADHDGDGTGDKADADDDNDGVADVEDLFPKNAARWDLASFKFVATAPGDRLGSSVAGVGDVDGDGHAEILLAAAGAGGRGSFYLVSTADLADADASDGLEDGQISTAFVARQARSMVLTVPVGYDRAGVVGAIGDIGGDGHPEFGVGAEARVARLYVVSGADLHAADADDGYADHRVDLDGLAVQAGSRKLESGWAKGFGTSLASLGDADADGFADFLVGEPESGYGIQQPGTVHWLDGAWLAATDAMDGNKDGNVIIRHPSADIVHLVGEDPHDKAGTGLAAADFDADGTPDLVIGAPGHNAGALDRGAVYVVGSRDRVEADSADGASDDEVALENTYVNRHSWKIVGQFAGDRVGEAVATGDVDGDGVPDLVIGAAGHDAAGQAGNGAVYVISGTRRGFARHDLADGTRDGVIQLGTVGTKREGWKLIGVRDRHGLGHALQMTNDVDGDGLPDILVAGRCPNVAHVLGSAIEAPKSAAPASSFDPSKAHGEVRLGAAAGPTVWSFLDGCGGNRRSAVSIGSAGDVDGDGLTDLLIGFAEDGASAAYLVNAADLPHLDAADRTRDRVIHLHSVVGSRR